MKNLYYIVFFTILACGATLGLLGCKEDDPDPPANNLPAFENASYSFSISQDAMAGDKVGTVSATDEDDDALRYSISTSEQFEIADPTLGDITVQAGAVLTVGDVNITAEVNDGEATVMADVTITVTSSSMPIQPTPSDNTAPEFEQSAYTFQVTENTQAGFELGTVLAMDAENNDLEYSFANTSVEFVINSITGSITVSSAARLNYEMTTSYSITVEVEDNGSPALTDQATVTIEIQDVDEPFAFVFIDSETEYSVSVADGLTEGKTIFTVTAEDPEGDAAASYALSGEKNTDFAIANDGEITVADGITLSKATTPAYTLMVQATSVGGAMATAVLKIDIEVPTDYLNGNTLIDIATIEQLNAIRWDLDGDGAPSVGNEDMYEAAFLGSIGYGGVTPTGYELINNLDFDAPTSYGSGTVNTDYTEGDGWDPIGFFINDVNNDKFTATLDGNGNTISNLYIDRINTNGIGLMATTSAGSVIRNISLVDSNIIGRDFVGPLVGDAGGMFEMCTASGIVDGRAYVGGLVGRGNGTSFTSCNTSTTVMGTGDDISGFVSDGNFVGGLVGHVSDGTFNDCSTTGAVTSTGFEVGGLIGRAEGGTVTNCFTTGTVQPAANIAETRGSNYGGLIGDTTDVTIMQCYTTGNISGTSLIGGLVGESDGPITACYAEGNISGGASIGGLVGWANGTLTNSYATGNVNGALTLGGLVGTGQNTITMCYATGDVTADEPHGEGNVNLGGLVGQHGGDIVSCYATGDVTVTAVDGRGENMGGLVGWTSSTPVEKIEECYATGDVTGDIRIGGLVGRSGSAISKCYATGDVTGMRELGGLVGNSIAGAMTACYTTGNVTGVQGLVMGVPGGESSRVGGLVGVHGFRDNITGAESGGEISACYTSGTIMGTTGGTETSGLVAFTVGSASNINSYFDSTLNPDLAAGVAGKTTAELQGPVGFTDIYSAWSGNPWNFGTTSQYPVLEVDFNKDGSTADDVTAQRP